MKEADFVTFIKLVTQTQINLIKFFLILLKHFNKIIQ